MKISQAKKSIIIEDNQGDIASFLMKLTHEYKTFETQNIIIDLSFHQSLTIKQINTFLNISKNHRKNKKSFVIVVPKIDFTKISEKLTVVPSLLEANDVIDMEEIERDLGF